MRESPERQPDAHCRGSLKRWLALGGLLCAVALPGVGRGLPQPVEAALRAVDLPREAVGVWVAPVRGGSPVLAERAQAAFAPASTIKTLTTIVALDTLGPNWRGATRLLTRAPIRGAGNARTIEGDLILRGEVNVDFDGAQLDQLLRRLRAQGVRHIAGDWIVDRSFLQPARMDIGVPPFDESPEFRYNVIPDALFLGGNLVALELGADREAVRVLAAPELPGVRWHAAFELIEGRCAAWEDGWRLPRVTRVGSAMEVTLEVTLEGTFPKDCVASTQINVIDRDEYVARLLAARWASLGGTLGGRIRFNDSPLPDLAALRELAVVRSRSLAEIARDIQRRSDNPITRMVYLALGAHQAAPGETTAQAAERVMRGWLAERGIAARGLVLDNGSGLSRSERIAPRTLGEALLAARRSPWWPEFAYGLPVAGRDGSLARRLRGSAAAALPTPARLKTGTLRDVGALAGFITAADGEEYVFVAMVNHPEATSARAHPVLDTLVEWVAQAGWRTAPWEP